MSPDHNKTKRGTEVALILTGSHFLRSILIFSKIRGVVRVHPVKTVFLQYGLTKDADFFVKDKLTRASL